MSNIISFPQRIRPLEEAGRIGILIDCFCNRRRTTEDVFWLKENAELLNLLETSTVTLNTSDLTHYQNFYDSLEHRLCFFPQYYRFILSLALDLEALGLGQGKSAKLCEWVVDHNLVGAELSDLQRAEAARLLKRGLGRAQRDDPTLVDRLHGFIDQSETFSIPNKKAAYELTHIVFYLSEYGRKDPGISADAVRSLEFAGLLALLDHNTDLLAEICIALRFAGQTPPLGWEDWVFEQLAGFKAVKTEIPRKILPGDEYHSYLMCSWLAALSGTPLFEGANEPATLSFHPAPKPVSALRGMSESIFQMDNARSADWFKMRGTLTVDLSPQAYRDLQLDEASSDKFDEFFHGFARCTPVLK